MDWTDTQQKWPDVHPVFNGSKIYGSDWLDVRLSDGVEATGKLMLDQNFITAENPHGAYYWLVRIGVMTYRAEPTAWRPKAPGFKI